MDLIELDYKLETKDGKPYYNGWLDLSNTAITSLPEGLTVNGSLDLNNTAITSLPEGLTVNGSLYLSNTAITSLPEGLTVNGRLDLRNTAITSLPEGLTVNGWLDLRNTAITGLPEGLTVNGWLYLSNTAITNYPVVYNCGKESRAIYLSLTDKSTICIGCFRGTKEEAISAISLKYSGKAREDYIKKVKECFSLVKETRSSSQKGLICI